MFLQLIDDDDDDAQMTESAVGRSSEDITATSILSDKFSDDITAERRRELWSEARDRPNCMEVSATETSLWDSFVLPTQSTSLGLDDSRPHYSLSQSGGSAV